MTRCFWSRTLRIILYFYLTLAAIFSDTRLCEAGVNLKVIQDILGHVDVSTTMNIYVDAMKELKKKEMSAFSSRTGPSGSAGMTLEELSQVKTTEQWTTA